MAYTLLQIAEALHVKPVGNPDPKVERLLIDSRSLIQPEGTLFIALKTAKNDGHKYIPELYQRGIRMFLVSEEYYVKTEKDVSFIVVKDTLNALQSLAS